MSKESRTYKDVVWQKEQISNCQIKLLAKESYSEFKFILIENDKTVIFNLNPNGSVFNWTSTEDAKEYNMYLYKGKDIKQNMWNIEIYTPKDKLNKSFIILYNEQIIIKYKM
ncbi:hypothetical protein [Ferruginibacter sp.]|uniref:hypothetical protein n=1 Tax=Ferruginibacter sp. TaxID=1940288 RepID=UPI0019B2801F|nr:hypothetical protein [Ferruginibacter sp.]MBC7626160.1 hypothetical protein [Ferruginibacter sp.]